jgi:hypothetical protein
VTVAILNQQTADEVLTPRISEHEALTAYQAGTAGGADHEVLFIAARVGLHLADCGVEPDTRPVLSAFLDMLDGMEGRPSATDQELELMRRMVAAHDRQREQIGRGDYWKASMRWRFLPDNHVTAKCNGTFSSTCRNQSKQITFGSMT